MREGKKDRLNEKQREQVSLCPSPSSAGWPVSRYSPAPFGHDEGVTCKQLPCCAIVRRLLGPIRPPASSGFSETPSVFFTHTHTHTLTVHRCSFGKDRDGSLGHSLLANHGRDFGTPAVRTHPEEVTRLVVPFSCVENSSVGGKTGEM